MFWKFHLQDYILLFLLFIKFDYVILTNYCCSYVCLGYFLEVKLKEVDCTKGGVSTTKVPNVQQGVKAKDNMHATKPNDNFWGTPIGLKMMNDMMEKHETSS
jgi:hypothetical protein